MEIKVAPLESTLRYLRPFDRLRTIGFTLRYLRANGRGAARSGADSPLPAQGPRNWPWPVLSLSKGQAAGAAAPLGGRELHAVSDRGGLIFPSRGPRNWLCQAAGAAAPLGGRELHAVSDRGGFIPRRDQ